MSRILSIPERIRLFKEINRIHKQVYGWRMLYNNAWSKVSYIDIDRDTLEGFDKWVPMDKTRETEFYFQDDKGRDITSLRGLFSWGAYYFDSVNPYKYSKIHEVSKINNFNIALRDEDFIYDNKGKRVGVDISHPVHCMISLIEVQQRKDDGKIWISSNWLYDPDCYAAASSFLEAIGEAVNETSRGNKKLADELWGKFEESLEVDRREFDRNLKIYFRGGKMTGKNWFNEYVLAASRPWKIKDMEQLEEALKVEDRHFRKVLEEFIQWFRNGGLNLGDKAEEVLRKRLRALYSRYPCDVAKSFCRHLVEEDNKERSDVYLWWGGEPNRDGCYALLTLYFEIDPEDIGTPEFDEKVSRNLRTIINIAEEEYPHLSTYRDIEPHVWRAIFS